MELIMAFFEKMGDKNPELCLVVVFTLLMTLIFLYYTWKSNGVIQTLFADYKGIVEKNTEAINKNAECHGVISEVIRKCQAQAK